MKHETESPSRALPGADSPATFVSQAEYARRHGVTPKTATIWKQKGLIVVTDEGVDIEASDERLSNFRNPNDGRGIRGSKPQKAALAAEAIESKEDMADLVALYMQLRREKDALERKVKERITDITEAMQKIEEFLAKNVEGQPPTWNSLWIKNLSDGYVRTALRAAGIEAPSPELIGLKREQLSLRRLAKRMENAVTKAKEES